VLTTQQIERYREHGYLVVPGVLARDDVDELRAATEALLEGARAVTSHTDVYDLEDGHTPASPRVRRIKTPHRWHPAYARVVRQPGILACLRALWGPNIRFDTSKLNVKDAAYGSPVEWHQDWAFYPHTNDELAAVGIMLDDVGPDNGPMLVIPGSHRGPIYDHHDASGRFCGAIDVARARLDVERAVPCTGPAGSVSIHHVRAVHGSAPNTSSRPRRLLLHQYRAADAWPLVHRPDTWEAYTSLLVSGEETLEPRLTPVPVRLPFPPAEHQGSIYENQRTLDRRYFADALAGASRTPAPPAP